LRQVHQPVQQLPSRATQTANPAVVEVTASGIIDTKARKPIVITAAWLCLSTCRRDRKICLTRCKSGNADSREESEQSDHAAEADQIGQSRSWRAGVIASTITRNRMVQSPVKCVMNSMGFAPSWLCKAYHASASNGTGTTRTPATSPTVFSLARLVILFQVHACV